MNSDELVAAAQALRIPPVQVVHLVWQKHRRFFSDSHPEEANFQPIHDACTEVAETIEAYVGLDRRGRRS